jgi:spore maturation protein CgeB
MRAAMKVAFFGSSLVSPSLNGEAACYRGLLKALAGLGHDITFYEPDAFGRQLRRDICNPPWARLAVWPATSDGWQRALDEAASSDLIVKASGIGVFDAELEEAVPVMRRARGATAFWDMDAPATLDAVAADPAHRLRAVIPHYDLVLAFGGGAPAVNGYGRIGARRCAPVYNALDPETHFPAPPRMSYQCDLNFMANRLPGREGRVDAFFMRAAAILRHHRFLLAGSGWHGKVLPANVGCVGHIGTDQHNAFFGSGLATLNIARDSMARYGYAPPARIFEATGAGACLIADAPESLREGIAAFLEPGREVLVAAGGEEVAELVADLMPEDARAIAAAARARILAHHTWERRACEVDALLEGRMHKDEAAA